MLESRLTLQGLTVRQTTSVAKMIRFKLQSCVVVVVLMTTLFWDSNGHVLTQNQTWPRRSLPGDLDFPGTAEFYRLGSLLSGELISLHDPRYHNMTMTWNVRVLKSPFMFVYPHTVEDVQRAVLFARQFNMHMSIRSSGHSFIGRSTHDGSLNVNFAEMKSIKINLISTRNPAGEVTVQSGASWLEVFKKVNETMGPDESGSGLVGRVVVGGSAHTVAMGGYTQGGGHAPICRRLGLAVDNLLEATIVAADGRVMTVSDENTVIRELNGTTHQSSDTSLFWAIRGGGGGTWGVITSFTFKLHYAPKRIRLLTLYYPLFGPDGKELSRSDLMTVFTEVNKLSEDWGGYIIASGAKIPSTSDFGSVGISLIHFGNDSSPSNKEVDTLIQKTKPIYKSDTNYRSFFDYEVTPKDGPGGNVYIINTFVQRSTITDTNRLSQYLDLIYEQTSHNHGCTLTLIGGKVIESHGRPATPVHPGFRSGLFSESCGTSWNYNPLEDETHIDQALDMAIKLYPFGKGSYFNEPAEDMPDWKQRFWADDVTYNRLLKIKQQFDPDNYFWCHNCVASDLGHRYGDVYSDGIPGKPWPGKYGNFNYTCTINLDTGTSTGGTKQPEIHLPVIG